ncbi:hypothetical protein BCR33DRAFT_740313 [Rhizoclosmatium globosum]|uniref:S-adenosyl-L-methionine-dependent methyltransferase n=1 Tax=Rhizoclosmatium globosum TaxID=329046 RepID=A0A1Y2C0D2_9FUNG|nr:hypothetical protein BCR33DRAFT_740313 [Rhizoclosmatium globosum]|eukprot:ORY40469.1 hypothetical protein BCR33DRAFT_740313 [Rhizoclosmatium globosum]
MIWDQLWNSGIVLSRELDRLLTIPSPTTEAANDTPKDFINPSSIQTILELGTGRGLAGLTAATLLPNAKVVLTDASTESLQNASDAITLNNLQENCSTATLNWFSPSQTFIPADLVIGADVLYLSRAVKAIASLLKTLMTPVTGKALIVDPDRCFAEEFENLCIENNLAVRRVIVEREEIGEGVLGESDANVQCKRFNVFYVSHRIE